jgi:hypothetical protein
VYGVDIAAAVRRQGKERSWRRWRGTRGGTSSCAGGGEPGEGPVLAPAEGNPGGRGSRAGGEGAGRQWSIWNSWQRRGGCGGRGPRTGCGEAVAAVVLAPAAGRQWSSRRRLRAVERLSTRHRRGGSGGLEGKTAREEQERVSTARIEECVDKAVGEFFPPSRRTWLVFHLLFSLPRVVVD